MEVSNNVKPPGESQHKQHHNVNNEDNQEKVDRHNEQIHSPSFRHPTGKAPMVHLLVLAMFVRNEPQLEAGNQAAGVVDDNLSTSNLLSFF